MNYSSELEATLKRDYPEGTRVRCVNMPNDPQPIPAGTEGTVRGTNGSGQIFVRWDNGSGLNLIVGVDEFVVID